MTLRYSLQHEMVHCTNMMFLQKFFFLYHRRKWSVRNSTYFAKVTNHALLHPSGPSRSINAAWTYYACIFMHVNAPSRASKNTSVSLAALGIKGEKLRVWPRCSPDLNPIDNHWSILKQKLWGWEAVHIKTAALGGYSDILIEIAFDFSKYDLQMLQIL